MSWFAKRKAERRQRLLDTLAQREEWYGTDLWHASGVGPGRMYPLLDELVEEGIVERRWEFHEHAKAPFRRAYRLVNR